MRNDWSDLTLRTDALLGRGLGSGWTSTIRTTRATASRGRTTSTITPRRTTDGLPAPRENRGELTLRDRENLGDGWKADLELGYLSDRHFLYTYDRRSLDEDMDRETRGVPEPRLGEHHVHRPDRDGRSMISRTRLERDSVAYHVIGAPIFDTPLLWTTHTDLSELRMRYDKASGLPNPDRVDRLDSANEVSYPLQLGFIRAEPFLWGDLTGYNEQGERRIPSLRAATAYGVRAAANFYRTYETQSSLFEVDRLRHILTPTVEYVNLFYVNRDPSHYIQNDEIDALDEAALRHVRPPQPASDLSPDRRGPEARRAVPRRRELSRPDPRPRSPACGRLPLRRPGIPPFTGDFVEGSAPGS